VEMSLRQENALLHAALTVLLRRCGGSVVVKLDEEDPLDCGSIAFSFDKPNEVTVTRINASSTQIN
jgi:hypothetical protein